jgi:hypothetical protein
LSDGSCVRAFRAFCPERCLSSSFRVASSLAADLSDVTTALLATRLLQLVTSQSKSADTAPRTSGILPRCPSPGAAAKVYNNTPECSTPEEVEAQVKRNYVMVNVELASMEETVFEMVEMEGLSKVAADIGGTLALFFGASICSIIEGLEVLLFAIVAGPLLLCGCGSCCVRKTASDDQADKEDAEGDLDADAKRVLLNIRAIAARRRGGQHQHLASGAGFGAGFDLRQRASFAR